MTTLRPNPTTRPAPSRPTMRLRAQLPAFIVTPPAPAPSPIGEATHDFLVPNPRPDLAAPFGSAR